MKTFVSNFPWIMLVSGILTCTMLLGFFLPETSLKSNFGETIDSHLARLIVQNWSALIGLMGVMLMYGAFVPAVRNFVLMIVGISKIIFISLVLSAGKSYLAYGVGTAIIVDSVMVVLYAVYLWAVGRKA